MKKRICYIAHPISGDIDANLADLARILRIINTNSAEDRLGYMFIHPETREQVFPMDFCNIIPLAPYYADIISLDDNNPLERKRGIENDIAIIMTGVFDELWLTGNKISFGMQEEIKLFRSLGKPIIDYTNKI